MLDMGKRRFNLVDENQADVASFKSGEADHAGLWAVLACATATLCYGIAANATKRFLSGVPPLVVATGKRNIVTADMVKPGAVVIDVGMNRDDAGKLCGDVDYGPSSEVAGWITPVPGGVGPMTITMLLVNTIEAAERG